MPDGRIESIWIKRARRGVMDAVTSARAIEGRGLEGNAGLSRFRQVTLIERDAWEAICRELGEQVPPVARRANILLSGVDLRECRGRVLRAGEVRLLIKGETKPCERMDEARAGLRAAMEPDWRGGAFAQVLNDGEIAVGDPVIWEPEG